AIPIDLAMDIQTQLRAKGKVSRGRLGIGIQEVSKELAESIGLGKPQGALVRSVESGAPAAVAGVEAGDIITRFDGKTIEKSSDLPRMVGNTKPGSKATLTVFRRGASRDLTVTVAELEPDRPVRRAADREEKPKPSGAGQAVGLTVSDLSDAQKRELQVRGGVKVDAATEAAARAGLREGDIITAISNTEVSNVKEFDAALARADRSKPIALLFRRGELAQFALIRPQR
ncbi:MAG: PDZ domain-containing protein, partial [Burkholderiaceae bacterium]